MESSHSTFEQRPLTPRELQVLYHIKQGEPNKSIAKLMNTSQSTTCVHVRNILSKLNVRNRTEAALKSMGKVMPDAQKLPVLRFVYTNHKSQVRERSCTNPVFFFGATEYYPDPQWLFHGFDLDRQANRTYAVKNVIKFKDSSNAVSSSEILKI